MSSLNFGEIEFLRTFRPIHNPTATQYYVYIPLKPEISENISEILQLFFSVCHYKLLAKNLFTEANRFNQEPRYDHNGQGLMVKDWHLSNQTRSLSEDNKLKTVLIPC